MSKFQRAILITGGTAGLGYQCAINVAREFPDYQIVVASRTDPNSSAAAINEITGYKNVIFMPLHLSDISQVRSFAIQWETKRFPPIHSLVFNAALQFPGDVQYTVDGFEKTFAISHIGNALLFSLLRQYLADTARLVIVSSGTHDPAKRTGMPDAHYSSAEELAHPTKESAKNNGRQRYTTVKLVNILYMYALNRRFVEINQSNNHKAGGSKHWTIVAFDPGLVPGTGLTRDASSFLKFLFNKVFPRVLPLLRALVDPNIHTPEDSGKMMARLVIASDEEIGSGVYYEGAKRIKSSEVSYDKAKQEDLWEWTAKTLTSNEEEKAHFQLQDLI